MFYTKYRPQTFSQISRPNEAADALSHQVVTGKTVHAYLFVGPRGTGKTSTARILAKALNCVDLNKNGDPCDVCSSCEAIKKGSYLDLIEIDAASNRGIDDIRELKNRVKLAPTTGKNKTYIIDEVHMLTSEAFNALLKTLEEPPANTVFILCTTELHKVPDTIKSRCQVFKFRRATIRQLVTKLQRIVDEEALTVDKDDLDKIARASLGGFRDAETMLQQIAEGDVTVDSLLNVGSKEKYLEFFDLLSADQVQPALKMVNKIFNEGADLYVWSGEFIKHLREILMLKSGVSAEIIDVPDELISQMKEQASGSLISWLVNALEVFVDAQSKVKNSFIPQLPLEIAVVKICNEKDGEYGAAQVLPDSPKSKTRGGDKKSLETNKDLPVEVEEVKEVEEAIDATDDTEILDVVISNENAQDAPLIEITLIIERWQDVVQKISQINSSILGLLRAARPAGVTGNFLILGVSYSFHKERLEALKNRQVVEQVLKDIFNCDLHIKCSVTEEKRKLPVYDQHNSQVGVLTDFNVIPIDKTAVLDMLDGGLPL